MPYYGDEAGTFAGSRGALDAAPLDAVRRRQRLPRDDHLDLGQSERQRSRNAVFPARRANPVHPFHDLFRSEEHTSELQSLMRISYAVFCLKKKNNKLKHT